MSLPKPDGSYSPITTLGDLKDLAYILTDFGKIISVDTETTGTDYLTCDLVGIAITHDTKRAWYIPVGSYTPDTFEQLSIFQVRPRDITLEELQFYLNPILASPNIIKVLHNAKFDLHVLRRHGFTLEEPIYDTMLATQVLTNCFGNRYGLKELAATRLGYDMTEFKEVTQKNGKFYNVPLQIATDYAAADVDMTLRLREKLLPAFTEKYPSLIPISDLEMKTIPVLVDMETHGTLVNVPYLRSVGKDLKVKLGKLYNGVQDLLNAKININSNQELKDVLEKRLKIQLPNVDAKTLDKLKSKHPVIEEIIKYRQVAKLESTYVRGILEVLGKDNRCHTEFWQILKTGRLSSNRPNMQNLPTLKEDQPPDWPSIRRAIIVPEGHKFVSIDYSQLELRIITHISQEPVWIEAFNNNEDIHAATAKAIFGELTKDGRKKAKIVNFGLLYGMSAFGLSNRMGLSVEEAEEFIKNYFSILPNVEKYIEDINQQVLDKKYVDNPNGRRLYFRFDNNDEKSLRAAQREAVNFPIQSMAADIVKMSMRSIWEFLRESNLKTKMLIQVHDEICWEVPENEVDIVVPIFREKMENITKLTVPLKCDVEVGLNFEDLEEWKM